MALKLTILLLSLLFILAFLPRDQALSAHVTDSELNPEAINLMYGASEGSLRPQECGGRCTTRCSQTSFKKPCMFFCQKCCARCLCVPPGTYGNKQVCPCYNNWKTKRGGPKCP